MTAEVTAILQELDKRDLLTEAKKIAAAHRVTLDEMVDIKNKDPLARQARHAFWRLLWNDPVVEWSVRRIAALARCDRSTIANALKPRDRSVA